MKSPFTVAAVAGAPKVQCGHVDCDHHCADCWKIINYLFDGFGLDSWDGNGFWPAWYAIKGVLKGVALREAVVASAPRSEQAAIAAWKREWKSKPLVRCRWCDELLTPRECQVDHVIPIARGGVHALSNLVVACATCNRSKGASLPGEWKS